jgi:hypothetical protein
LKSDISTLFLGSCKINYNPIDEMPLLFYYPTLNEPQHQLIICNVGNPINSKSVTIPPMKSNMH